VLPDAPVTQAEFQDFRGEVQAEFASFRGEVKGEFASVRGELREFQARLFTYLDTQFRKIDRRFAGVDKRFLEVDGGFDKVHSRLTVLEHESHSIRVGLKRVEDALRRRRNRKPRSD
jgi:hypothetical protein